MGRISAHCPRRRYQELQESQIKSTDVNTRKVSVLQLLLPGLSVTRTRNSSAEEDRQEVKCPWLRVQYCRQPPGGAVRRCIRSDQDMSSVHSTQSCLRFVQVVVLLLTSHDSPPIGSGRAC